MVLTVLAILQAKDGMHDRVRQELLALIDPTRKEQGCISYDLHQHRDDPACFMFYENWRSREDLDQHLATPHLSKFLEQAEELLAKPVSISFYSRLA